MEIQEILDILYDLSIVIGILAALGLIITAAIFWPVLFALIIGTPALVIGCSIGALIASALAVVLGRVLSSSDHGFDRDFLLYIALLVPPSGAGMVYFMLAFPTVAIATTLVGAIAAGALAVGGLCALVGFAFREIGYAILDSKELSATTPFIDPIYTDNRGRCIPPTLHAQVSARLHKEIERVDWNPFLLRTLEPKRAALRELRKSISRPYNVQGQVYTGDVRNIPAPEFITVIETWAKANHAIISAHRNGFFSANRKHVPTHTEQFISDLTSSLRKPFLSNVNPPRNIWNSPRV